MRTTQWGLLAAITMAAVFGLGQPAAAAQDTPNPEQLKKMYDDALVQLKAAQERKNQLAAENEKLAAEVAGLKKQVDQMQGRMEELKRTDADHAEKTFFLRSHYAAWQAFVRRYPEMMVRWKVYIEADFPVVPTPAIDALDPGWPTGLRSVTRPATIPTTGPATAPATAPAPQPASQPPATQPATAPTTPPSTGPSTNPTPSPSTHPASGPAPHP